MLHILYTSWHLYTHLYPHLHVLFQAAKSFYCFLQSVYVFAEGEASVSFANIGVLVAVELQQRMSVGQMATNVGIRTSLTGIEETPSSQAMNQQALSQCQWMVTEPRNFTCLKSRPLPRTLLGNG